MRLNISSDKLCNLTYLFVKSELIELARSSQNSFLELVLSIS